MTAAIEWFEQRGLVVERVSALQLKYGDLNYYPHSGAMNFDQQPRMRGVGLDALAEVLDELEAQASCRKVLRIQLS